MLDIESYRDERDVFILHVIVSRHVVRVLRKKEWKKKGRKVSSISVLSKSDRTAFAASYIVVKWYRCRKHALERKENRSLGADELTPALCGKPLRFLMLFTLGLCTYTCNKLMTRVRVIYFPFPPVSRVSIVRTRYVLTMISYL